MCVSYFYEYKTTKKHCCEQKIKGNVFVFKTILVISQIRKKHKRDKEWN